MSFGRWLRVWVCAAGIIASALAGQPGGSGPDVIVGDLPATASYGTLGDTAGFSIGTTACNIGTAPLAWNGSTAAHPVIGQNLFRLRDGRFEHIGQSWVKHGFAALQEDACGCGCVAAPTSAELGAGCSDPYTAGFNGAQEPFFTGDGGLGPKSDIQPADGAFAYPYTGQGTTGDALYKRLQVAVADLDPAQRGGGLYFIEGQYVSAADHAAGNGANNASYRRVGVQNSAGTWQLIVLDETVRGMPAIAAWAAADPAVDLRAIDVPQDGRLWVAARVTPNGRLWRYEYAIHNLTSARSVQAVTVPLLGGATAVTPDFHDVDYHSGEVYDGTDWSAVAGASDVTWSTTAHAIDPLANALRWGTLYNFGFWSDAAPGVGIVGLALFEPGAPAAVTVTTWVPGGPAASCGNADLEPGEQCDPPDALHCGAACTWICGDGVIQRPETCDDGNSAAGDGCGSTCRTESNDRCAEATPAALGTTPFDTSAATTSDAPIANPACPFTTVYDDVWLLWTATCTGTATVSTCADLGGAAEFDTRLALYPDCDAAPDCPAGDAGACNDDDAANPCGSNGGQSTAALAVTAGQCIRIRLGGAAPGEQGTGTLAIQCAEATVACCLTQGCTTLTAAACATAGGASRGPGSTCAANPCTGGATCPMGTAAECCDLDGNTVRDDACTWCGCAAGACNLVPIPFGDMGGPFGSCAPDGFVNIHDRNHALNCFAGTSTCPPLNIDAGGPFGSCTADGFCNIHDANHALAVFAGTATCSCAPQPEPPNPARRRSPP